MDIDWGYIQEHWDWAGHIVEAIGIALVVALFARVCRLRAREAIIVGIAFAAGHFHGREKRDYEISVDMRPPHLEAYYFWRWNWDQTTDFWPVAIIAAILIVWITRTYGTDD